MLKESLQKQLSQLGSSKFVKGNKAANAKLARLAKQIAKGQITKHPKYQDMTENTPKDPVILDILQGTHIKDKVPIKDIVIDPIPLDKAMIP